MAEYQLPDVGEGLTEAEIVTWKVKVGDTVAINDVVVEIETAKSLVELPSPYAGTVSGLLVPEGETVAVGTPIIAIGDARPTPRRRRRRGCRRPAPPSWRSTSPTRPPAGAARARRLVGRNKADRGRRTPGPQRPPRLAGAGAATQHAGAGRLRARCVAAPEVPRVDADEPAVPATRRAELSSRPRPRVLAKPPVRKLAKDLGVDLATLAATGPNGAVSREDVEQAAADRRPAPDGARRAGRRPRRPRDARADQGRPQDDGPGDGRLGLLRAPRHRVGHRRRHPHHGARRAAQGAAASSATSRSRRCWCWPGRRCWRCGVRRWSTRCWDEAAQEVVYKRYVNLGIAAATPRGLVVPNVKDADAALAGRPGRRAGRAHRHRAGGQDAAGRDERRHLHDHQRRRLRRRRRHADHQPRRVRDPVLRRDQASSRGWCEPTATTRSWSARSPRWRCRFDHRHIDGAKGSRFLADVAGILEDPATALLF